MYVHYVAYIFYMECEEIGAVFKIRCNWADLPSVLVFSAAPDPKLRGARTEPRAHSTSCTKIKKIDPCTTYNHRNPQGKKINFAHESPTGIIKLATSLRASPCTKTQSSDEPQYTTN